MEPKSASINGLNYFQPDQAVVEHGLHIESEVEGADAVGEGSYRDQVDTCGGDVPDSVEGDAAAGFGESPAVDLLNCGPKIFDGEVVEENGVDVSGENVVDLVEAVNFDFEVSSVRESRARGQ